MYAIYCNIICFAYSFSQLPLPLALWLNSSNLASELRIAIDISFTTKEFWGITPIMVLFSWKICSNCAAVFTNSFCTLSAARSGYTRFVCYIPLYLTFSLTWNNNEKFRFSEKQKLDIRLGLYINISPAVWPYSSLAIGSRIHIFWYAMSSCAFPSLVLPATLLDATCYLPPAACCLRSVTCNFYCYSRTW